MNWSITLAIVGIFASIGVGFGTFYVADKRARRTRWQSSKDIVLRDLSKSLGEGNIPPSHVILATIRSVLRSQNARDLAGLTVDEIADDLLRQITSDPFLNAERRKQLQDDVLGMKTEAMQEEARAREEKEIGRERPEGEFVTWATAGALVAGVMTALTAGAIVTSPERWIPLFRDVTVDPRLRSLMPLLAGLITGIAAVLYLAFQLTPRDRKKK